MSNAPQPDSLGSEDTRLEDHASDVQTSAKSIEPLLRDDGHEGEESAEVIDG
jgi:hypothetical protein